MRDSYAKLSPFVPAAAAAAAALAACVALAASAGGVPAGTRGHAAACAAVLLAALVLPAISIASSREGPDGPGADARRWGRFAGGAFGGTALGALVFALAAARPVLGAVFASLVVVGSCAASFGALARVIGRATRSSVAGGSVAGAALLVMIAAPFWSRGILASGAGGWLAKPLVGASPFLAAALPWTAASPAWTFDPKVSNVLYRLWVGTDFPVVYPSWMSCVAGHVLVAALLVAAAELPRVLRERRRSGGSATARPGSPESGAPG